MRTSTTKLILGTVQLGLKYGINNAQGKPSRSQALALLAEAYQLGIRTVDSSFAYGDAHDILQDFSAQRTLSVCSKFSLRDYSTPALAYAAAQKKLAKHSVDYFLFHDPEEGLRYRTQETHLPLGLSLYSENDLEKALELPWVKVLQLPANLLDFSARKRQLFKEAKKRNITLHVRSVFLQGLFFKDPQTLPLKLQPLKKYLEKLAYLAEQNAFTMRELALSYIAVQDEVAGVVFGVDNSAQLRENIQAATIKIPERLLQEIRDIKVVESQLLNPSNWQ